MIREQMAEPPILDRSIRILAIEADPVILSGLITCLNRFPDLQVSAEAEDLASAWQILTAPATETLKLDLILLGLPLSARPEDRSILSFWQQVKARYPNLPILLLASPQDRVTTAFQVGIEGCCLRGSSILDLVTNIRQVAAGQNSWAPEILERVRVGMDTQRSSNPLASLRDSPWQKLRQRLRSSSLQQIESTLTDLTTNLDFDRLSTLDRLVLNGRRRELNTARWLVKQLFPSPDAASSTAAISPSIPDSLTTIVPTQLSAESSNLNPLAQTLFDRIASKLQSSLENLTPTPLEIDILRQEKKRELFYLILRQVEGLLNELRFSQVTIEQLSVKQSTILKDLWASVTTDFFGRYHTLSIADRHVEIIPTLLQDEAIVQTEILAKIPQSIELFNYLLFKIPLTIDNTICTVGSAAAEERACELLENLTIHLANAVMQPLLNNFGNVESMKSGFYDRRLLSSREIERFRNDLSWRYRIDRYISEPQAIFESQHRLFIFTTYGIKRVAIYAPRPQELARLAGIPLVVTLALETRDAISPRLRSATTFLGSGIVYLLTEIIGRGIGLIGRGIIKGIGNIWQESNRIRKE
jgi:DNA-binding NarL/FixJ family response regulator